MGTAQIARGDTVQHFCHVFEIPVDSVGQDSTRLYYPPAGNAPVRSQGRTRAKDLGQTWCVMHCNSI
eukprot:3139825-Prymnesium_polylepis.1